MRIRTLSFISTLAVVLAVSAPASAFQFLGDQNDEARGMVVLSFPFNQQGNALHTPELSLELGMRKDYIDQKGMDRFDNTSGVRLPEVELHPFSLWTMAPEALAKQNSQGEAVESKR